MACTSLLTLFALCATWQLFASSTCAATSEGTQERIVGGEDAKPGQFPFQLSLQQDHQHICGAALAESNGLQVALTAAHCLGQPHAQLSLMAGDVSLQNNTTGHKQTRVVLKAVVHENYTLGGYLSNDIGILFLNSPFEISDYVKTINLPYESQETMGNVTVSGWGRLYGGGPVPDTLQAVNLTVVDFPTCKEKYSHIGDGVLCAGVPSGEQSTCFGDSGGPACALDLDGNGYLAGLSSFVKDRSCKTPYYPAGFTKVSTYVSWIHTQVQGYILDTASE